MSWETISIEKWKLPDGSIFVIETREDDKFSGFGDHLIDAVYGGSDELYYDDTHEINTYFEKNNGNWKIIKIRNKNDDWTKSHADYKFASPSKTVKLNQCKKIG